MSVYEEVQDLKKELLASRQATLAAYRQGYRDALTNYAIYKNGVQVVGCMETPLKEVIQRDEQKPIPVRY